MLPKSLKNYIVDSKKFVPNPLFQTQKKEFIPGVLNAHQETRDENRHSISNDGNKSTS